MLGAKHDDQDVEACDHAHDGRNRRADTRSSRQKKFSPFFYFF